MAKSEPALPIPKEPGLFDQVPPSGTVVLPNGQAVLGFGLKRDLVLNPRAVRNAPPRDHRGRFK